MRSSIERLGWPKTPIWNVVVQMIVRLKTNVAAAVNTGLQRAAIHKNSGKSEATINSTAQRSLGKRTTNPLKTATSAMARPPSRTSPPCGGSRHIVNNPTKSGEVLEGGLAIELVAVL